MRKGFYSLLALFTLTFALMIQIDLVSILTVAASGITLQPIGIYLLWIPVELLDIMTYRFYVDYALWFFIGSDILILLVVWFLYVAFKKNDRYPSNRYRF